MGAPNRKPFVYIWTPGNLMLLKTARRPDYKARLAGALPDLKLFFISVLANNGTTYMYDVSHPRVVLPSPRNWCHETSVPLYHVCQQLN